MIVFDLIPPKKELREIMKSFDPETRREVSQHIKGLYSTTDLQVVSNSRTQRDFAKGSVSMPKTPPQEF